MATSAESNASQKFIAEQKTACGRILTIDKRIDKVKVGVADIEAVYCGMPLFAESKWVNKFTHVNKEPFKPMQIEFLEKRARSGAMCIGLLLSDEEPRFIMWDELVPHITKEQFHSAEIFNWEKLRSVWMENVLTDS